MTIKYQPTVSGENKLWVLHTNHNGSYDRVCEIIGLSKERGEG